ncbi:hypothetical protein [Caballeronia grimmiae]|uniref:Uncharacterized protein n=1 Tax=Caballeronia grimmiae TaxID=1071679 RepID=A0A069NQZ6_9BURK|nr:hypothetical protein [Caballeronia grimmiae]KDR30790.1 hypothetical protein BG57_14350 [Caballeronia grimmiae]GGD91236.1 hypothetical protein GCM10010985_52440 [Caballeronia grimmiae]
MTIPTIEYRGYELGAYSHQVFPLHRDPYAKGPRQFSSFVRIDTIPSSEAKARRYATLFDVVSPATMGAAIDLAMQYGKDIVDGKVKATEL